MVDNRLSGGELTELPTYTCNHCNRVVLMNPQRTRERGFCRACNSYLCDECNAVRVQTMRCRTFEQHIDEVLTAAEQGREPPQILLP
jgi:hypothetical protein